MLAPFVRTLLRRPYQQTKLMKMRVSLILFMFIWPKQVLFCLDETGQIQTRRLQGELLFIRSRNDSSLGSLSAYFHSKNLDNLCLVFVVTQ